MQRQCYVSIYATNQVEGQDGQSVADYARANGEVPVQSFDAEITLEEFFELVKRFHIVVGSRVMDGAPMTSPTGE